MTMHKKILPHETEKDLEKDELAAGDDVGPNLVPVMRELEEMAHLAMENQELRPQSQRDLRALAFSLIYAVDRHDYTISLEKMVEIYQHTFKLEVAHDSYALTLARGVIASRDELDNLIKPLLKNWKFERLGCCTRLILRLALWELMQADALTSVIINEAIELSKAFAEKDAYKFINGILDEYCKLKHLKKE